MQAQKLQHCALVHGPATQRDRKGRAAILPSRNWICPVIRIEFYTHSVTRLPFEHVIFCLPPSRAQKVTTWASPCQATQWIFLRWRWPRLGRTWLSWRSSLMPTTLFSCWWTLGRVAGCLLSSQPARGRYCAVPFISFPFILPLF